MEEELYLYYKKLLSQWKKDFIFRIFDISDDKAFLKQTSKRKNATAANTTSARGMHFVRENIDIFTTQIKALLRARATHLPLTIMFPMIASLEDIHFGIRLVEKCLKALKQENIPHKTNPKIGIMVETPIALHLIKDACKIVDFFSIGTNDLIQFLLGIDRKSANENQLYYFHHPLIFREIADFIAKANQLKLNYSVCGQFASQIKLLPFFLGIGAKSLTINPKNVIPFQNAIRQLDLSKSKQFSKQILKAKYIAEIDEIFKKQAKQSTSLI